MHAFVSVSPISKNLTETQCICKLDYGKVLLNGLYSVHCTCLYCITVYYVHCTVYIVHTKYI